MSEDDSGRKPKTRAQISNNISEVKDMIFRRAAEIDTLEAQRKTINAEISAIIEDCEAKGINRHGLRAARRYLKMSPEQRDGYDLAYDLAREALGAPVQGDLLEAGEQAVTED